MKVKNIYDQGKEDECPNDTSTAEIEESVGDINDDNNGDNNEEKEAECLVNTSPDLMEEDVSDKKMTRMQKNIYQMLPHPYLRSFDGGPGDKLIKKNGCYLENQAETVVWECIESRIMSGDPGKNYKSILVKFGTKIGDGKRNTTINMQNPGDRP